jgi:SAM-dependent methyltransferase
MSVIRDDRNADQAASWNGAVGRRWVERQDFMDRMVAPVSEMLFAATQLRPGQSVLDIGCGSGATTLRIANAVSPGGEVVGLDISAPLLARARERVPLGAPVRFIEGDAMVYPFSANTADLLFSRFGVMFFADPVLAFANMRKGLKRGGRVSFVCWQALGVNPWVTIPLDAIRPLLPPAPPANPDAPGPYSLADDKKVERILIAAGYIEVRVEARVIPIDIAAGGGVEATVASVLEIGPSARALAEQPDAVRANAADAIRRALRPFEDSGSILLDAAIWLVSATAP